MADEAPDRRGVFSRRQVAKEIGVSVSTVWRLVRKGLFPPPMKLSPGRVGWRAVTVWRWLEEREAAARGQEEEL